MTAAPTRTGDRRAIVLAAGGTGGHMFPAEALARVLVARGERVVLITDRRGQSFGRDLSEVEIQRIHSATLQPGLAGKLRTAAALLRGYGEARGLLRSFAPAVVVGFGSYASAPTVYAAGRLRIPVVLHEQNAHVGRANRLVAGKARAIATSFPQVAGLKPAEQAKCVFVGNPVRPAIAALAGGRYRPPGAGESGCACWSPAAARAPASSPSGCPQAVALLPDGLRGRLDIVQAVPPGGPGRCAPRLSRDRPGAGAFRLLRRHAAAAGRLPSGGDARRRLDGGRTRRRRAAVDPAALSACDGRSPKPPMPAPWRRPAARC